MGEVASKAQLIDASTLGARSQIAATLSREDIEEALRLEESPELVLGIDRRSNGDVDAHTLRVAWTEDQLQELLRDTSGGEDITLYFDADELLRALADEDIEAHGMREKTAAVLTVATMAVGVGAAAHPAHAQAATTGTIEMVSDAASSGVPAAPELISDAASSGVATAPELISDAASGPGVDVVRASGPELISDAASGPGVDVVRASGPELISDAASGPGVHVAQASGPELISDAASGPGVHVAQASGPELVSDAASTGTPSPAQSTALAGVVSSTGSDSSLSATEIAGVATAGGIVLLITAAGFATRGQRRREQPA